MGPYRKSRLKGFCRRWATITLVLSALALSLLVGVSAADEVRQLELATNDIVYDPFTRKIYASVPSQAGSIGNSITVLDPVTGTVGPSVFVGSEPGKLAISDDGRFLYVALDGAGTVRRVDLPSLTPGFHFSLGADPFFGPRFAQDLQVLPGGAETVAVSMVYQNVSPRFAGVKIFDNGVPRTKSIENFSSTGQQVSRIEWASSSRLYGGTTEASPSRFYRMTVDSSGVTLVDFAPSLYGGFGVDIEFDGGRIYATSGEVVDPEAKALLGRFTGLSSPALVRPAVSLGRVFFLARNALLTFDDNTFLPVESLPINGISGTAGSLIRWGPDGLAFRTSERQIFLISASPQPPAPPTVAVLPTYCTTCHSGDMVGYEAHITNPGPAMLVELKGGVRFPDGVILGFVSTEMTIPAGASVVPIIPTTSLPGNLPTVDLTVETALLEPKLGVTLSRHSVILHLLP